MSRSKKLAKNTIIYGIGNFGSKILSYVMVLLYSYYICPSDLGKYDLIITTIAMIQPIITCQISDGIYRFLLDKEKTNRERIIGTGKNFLLLMSLISIVPYLIISEIYNLPYVVECVLYFVTTIFYTFFLDVTRALKNNKLYAFSGILNSLIVLFLEFLGLVILKLDVRVLLLSKVFSNLITSVFLLVKQDEIKASMCLLHIDRKFFLELLKYSVPLVPNTICWWIVNSSDKYIILGKLGTVANGVYSISNKFPTVLTMIASVFYLAWQDAAIQEYNSEDRNSFFSNVFNKYVTLLMSLSIMLIPFTRLIIDRMVAEEYADAWKYTGFLYLGAVFSALCSFLGLGYQISKETQKSICSTIGSAILNIFINVILIKKYGLYAASFSTLLAYIFLMFVRIIHTQKYYQLKIKWLNFMFLFMVNIIVIILTNKFSDTICYIECFFGVVFSLVMNRSIYMSSLKNYRNHR